MVNVSMLAALPRPADAQVPEARVADRDGQAFAQHQAWLKAYEHAAHAARAAVQSNAREGPAAHDACGQDDADADAASGHGAAPAIDDEAPAPAMPETAGLPDIGAASGVAGNADVAGAARLQHGMPQGVHGTHTFDGLAPSRLPAIATELTRGPCDTRPAQADAAGPAEPFTPSTVFEQARRMRVFAPLPDACVTVYQDTSRLSLAVRDARLAEGEGESILQRLHDEGLPAGVRQLRVTVNGRHHLRDLSSEGN